MTRGLLLALLPLSLSLALAPAAALAQTEDVVWTSPVGVSVAGNSLTKTGATGWNADAVSLQTLESNGFVEFTATETASYRMLGLSKGNSNQNYTDIDFAIYPAVGTIYVYESGVSRGTFGSFASGDRFRVEVAAGVVRYFKNGSLLYTSTVYPQFPLLVDTALYTNGATLTDVKIGHASFAGAVGVSRSHGTLTKTGSTPGWNAGAASGRKIRRADGFVEFTATETDKRRAGGLSSGDSGQDVSDIDYALVLNADATLEVQEAGVSRGGFGAYASGDRLRVELQAGAVRYSRNGILLYTSSVAPAYPLNADTAFDGVGSTLTDIVTSDLVWTDGSGVTISGSSLRKAGGSPGWNAGAVSTAALASRDGYVEFTASETTTSRMCGLGTSDSGYGDADIDFAIQLTSAAEVKVLESGVLRGTFGSYAAGDRFRVEVQVGTVKYRKNGVVFYTSGVWPTYPLSVDASLDTDGATLTEVTLGSLVWRNDVGVAVRGDGLTATGGGWGLSGAASTAELQSGDGYVEFTAVETTSYRMLGLSKGDSNQNYTDIDFAIYPAAGTIYVYESGVSRGTFGSFASGARLRVAVEGGSVKYRRNGTLLYTSAVTPQYPLLVDTALYTAGGTIAEVDLGGDFEAPPPAAPTVTLGPGSGTYSNVLDVVVSTDTPGATIHYTTNGLEPTESDPTVASGGTVQVAQSLTLKAKAWKAGLAPSPTATGIYTLKVASATLSPGGSNYSTPQNVTVTCATPGAVIHYTTSGVDPTESDPTVASGSQVTVGRSLTLKVRAWKGGWTPSDVTTVTYTLKVANPSLTPPGGAYGTAQVVTVATTTPGATITYTMDGADPAETDPAVASGNSLTLPGSVTLKARAWRSGWTPSDLVIGTYLLSLGNVAAPTFSPTGGTYAAAQTVTLLSVTPGAQIRYTLDGSEPTAFSRLFTAPFVVAGSATVKAKAFKADWTPSATGGASYTIDDGAAAMPTLSLAAGSYTTRRIVTVTCATPGATIHYTTNGLDPTEADPTVVSGGTVLVDRAMILKAKAWATGLPASGTVRADYQVTGAIAAGNSHALALKEDGTLLTWGANNYGQLGTGSTTPAYSTTPVSVTGLTGVAAVASGGSFSLALTTDGRVFAWGANYYGQLGNGSTTPASSATPMELTSLSGIVAIAAGDEHALAVRGSDGVVFAWGLNNEGQLGIGSTSPTYSATPVQVSGLTTVVAVEGGSSHSLALKADGTAYSWGRNSSGQLGDGTATQRTSPVPVSGLYGVARLGRTAYSSHLLKADGLGSGRIWSSGNNIYGQLGDGASVSLRTSPVSGLGDVIALGGGPHHVLAALVDGTTLAWGYNAGYALGDGTTLTRTTPVLVRGMRDAVALAGGRYDNFSLALRADGSLWGWGYNSWGQLGDGTTTTRGTPAAVPGLSLAANAWLLQDSDGDGLTNAAEYRYGTDPLDADSNDDGIVDGLAASLGQSASAADADGDGLLNAAEIALGTDPFKADTDGDGALDGQDAFPLDPTKSNPPPNPADTTPPVVTLQEPTNAVPLP